MTYQQIADWCEENVPMSQAEDFADWLSMCEQEFLNAGHFLPEEAIPFIAKKWNKAHPEEKPVAGQSRIDQFNKEVKAEKISIHKKLEQRIDKFPAGTEFTPSQLSRFTGANKNTVRRELQEFVTEGKIQRVSRGRYRV